MQNGPNHQLNLSLQLQFFNVENKLAKINKFTFFLFIDPTFS